MKYLIILTLLATVGFAQSKLTVEQLAVFGPNIGYEFYYDSTGIDSIRYWFGKPMEAIPKPKTILGLKPIAKFKKEMVIVYKWNHRKRRFEDALEKLRVIGIYKLPDQSSLFYDGIEVNDGRSIRISFEGNGKLRTIKYHCPNLHKRIEDQLIARAWDILIEADSNLESEK